MLQIDTGAVHAGSMTCDDAPKYAWRQQRTKEKTLRFDSRKYRHYFEFISSRILWFVVWYVQENQQYLQLQNLHFNNVNSKTLSKCYFIFVVISN